MSNNTSLYSTTSSGNATVPPNNNTGLYNTTGVPQTINNNISVTGNITAGGYISAVGNVYGANLVTTGNVYAGNIIGNIVGNFVLSGGNTQVIFNNNNNACSSPAFTFNSTSNTLAVTGAVTATGNITGNYILGNGSQLTGLPATYGNSNVTTLLSAFGSNTVSTTGNVSAGYFLGDGSQLTNLPIPGVYGNTQVATFLAAFGSNVVSTTGNVTAGYFLGNGSQLTGITANYSNANVVSLLAAFGSNSISTTGNVTVGYVIGDGSQLTNLPIQPGTYSNSNVAAYLPIYTGDYAGGNMSLSGNVTAAVLKTSGATGNIVGANYVSANFYLGDGGLLSNISSSYGNAQVATFLNAFGSNTISSTGNITTTANISGNYILGNGSQLTGLPATYGNANVAAFMASFGSNTVSTTGNITGGNIIGNGQFLTNLPGANVTGSVAQANIANTANAVTGANVTGQVANALVAGTVYTNAQPNITSVGTLSALSVSGNIATGGILTDGYYYANGAPFTGGGGTYGNANVNSLLAAWGSNALSTTGNVTASYVVGNGSLLTNITGANVTGTVANATYATSAGTATSATTAGTVTANAQANITSVGTLSSLSVSGNTTSGNLLTGGLISAVGNVTGNYFIGNGSQLTGISGTSSNSFSTVNANGTNIVAVTSTDTLTLAAGSGITITGNATTDTVTITATGGGGSPGGNTTELQFNNAGAFAGNVAMTFDATSGNIILGNVAINGQRILPNNTGNLDTSLVTSVGANPWQLRVGNGFNGTYTAANAVFAQGSGNNASGVGSRILQSDVFNISNTSGRLSGYITQNYVNITGNITNNNSRYQGLASFVAVGGGANANTWLTTIQAPVQAYGGGVIIGNVNPNLNIGNTTVSTVTNQSGTITVGAGSTANTAFGTVNQIQFTVGTGNIGNVVGFMMQSSIAPANANIVQTSNAVSFYHAATTNSIGGQNNANIVRMATNYYAFRNDDDLARARLGMLDRFHELNANSATTTGTVNIDKTSGQVQTIYPTGNVTIGTFSNFVTRVTKPDSTFVNTADTVTLIIQQGATPYTITMPTGNTQIRYASGLTTVGATANTTVMISITGVYDYGVAANEYLITISPEFS